MKTIESQIFLAKKIHFRDICDLFFSRTKIFYDAVQKGCL